VDKELPGGEIEPSKSRICEEPMKQHVFSCKNVSSAVEIRRFHDVETYMSN
jgi:hypothetical protein